MLNRLARYQPILRLIRKYRPSSLIEIGSGSKGIGEFCSAKFVGVDIAFEGNAVPHINLVQASGAKLPFRDNSFEMAICMDVLEHVEPSSRGQVIQEALRVASRFVVIGFPAGNPAQDSDLKLIAWCKQKKASVPGWLDEHMRFPFPEEAQVVSSLTPGLTFLHLGNENLWLHRIICKWELHPSVLMRRCAYMFAYRLRFLSGFILSLVNFPPYYRALFIVHKVPVRR